MHTYKQKKQKIKQLCLYVLPHPPYSSDLVPTNYYLFHILYNKMQNIEFENKDDMEKFLKSFFDSFDQEFFKI